MKTGFTLIELLVVVLIIGILAAVALPQYEKAVLKSRLAIVTAHVKMFKDAQERYYMANGTYTTSLDQLDITFPQGSVISGGDVSYPDGTWLRFTSRKIDIYAWDKSRKIGYGIKMEQSVFRGRQPECMALGVDGNISEASMSVCRGMGGKSSGSGGCGSTDVCPPGMGGFGSSGAGRYQMYSLP